MSDYPEHEKMATLRPQIDVVTDFLEWCGSKGKIIVSLDPGVRERLVVQKSYDIRELLAAYFGINENEIEAEKRAMLATLRSR